MGITELQEEAEGLPVNSHRSKEIKEEISELTKRRKSAADLVEQLESGSADPELEQHVASEAIKEAEKQIEALQQESAALPANSHEQEAIADEIERLQATKESAEDMLAKAEATLKIQNAHRAKKSRQEVAGRREQKKKEDSAAVKIQSIQRGKIARRQVSAGEAAPEVASAVVEMADAHITELQEEAEGFLVTS